jgi:phenylacetate-CoA ligase
LVKRNTGGSTGEPLGFYSDELAGAIDDAHHRYLYTIMGYKNGDVIADSGGIFIPKKLRDKNIYWLKYPKNTVWEDLGYSALYLTDSTIKYYIENLLEVKPAILRGYPSFWNKIAEYILSENIKLNFKVKGVNLTAEMCSDEQKENIEKAFSIMVYFEYGHSEMSVFCYTDDTTYTYKSSPIYGYVEVIKDNGEPASLGEEGEIVATSFCNRGMPFIRYRTGDRGVVSYRNGGIVHFKKIQGRTQDYIISRDNQKIFLTALIFGQHFKSFRKISKWQLIQNNIGKVTIKIVKLEGYSQDDENEIKEKIQNVANIELNFDYVNEIPLTQRGKHMFLIQNIGSV